VERFNRDIKSMVKSVVGADHDDDGLGFNGVSTSKAILRQYIDFL
jgi:hypothetical protein